MDLSVGATDERDRPLPVAGLKGTPQEIERQWYEQVYRGRGDSMAQLTWRAVLIGSCLGRVLSSPGKCLAIDNQLGSLLQHIEGKGQ